MTQIRPTVKKVILIVMMNQKMTRYPDATAIQLFPPKYNSKIHGIICGKREIKLRAMVRRDICKNVCAQDKTHSLPLLINLSSIIPTSLRTNRHMKNPKNSAACRVLSSSPTCVCEECLSPGSSTCRAI